MRLDRNNNSGIIYRIAKSNLEGTRLYSFFSFLTITLAITFVATLVLFMQGAQTADKRILDDMQQVMYMDVTAAQLEQIAADPRTELLVPYKENDREFQVNGVAYNFYYFESHAEKIKTYVVAEGRVPERYNEIVVDRQFMRKLGLDSELDAVVSLDFDGRREDFVICGYTDRGAERAVQSIYTSRAFADDSPVMKPYAYTALVRIKGAPEMDTSVFETLVYEQAAAYGIERASVNINGKFQESLQQSSATLYGIAFIAILILAASAIVIYSIFYLSVTTRMQQIGQLQTIGMTQKQIRKMVRREGLMLSALAIPVGLIISGVAAYFLQPQGWSFTNYAVTAAAIGIFGILVVQLSIRKPAALAALVSPIEAARNTGGAERKEKQDQVHKRLTAFNLARLGEGRRSKKWWLTTFSLAFGGVIFMVAAAYLQSWDKEGFSRQDTFAEAEYQVSYLYSSHNPLPYGTTEMQMTGHLSEELKDALQHIPAVEEVKVEHGSFGNIEYQGSSWGQSFYRLTKDSREYFEAEMEGNNDYEYMAEHDGIIITDSAFSEKVNGVSFKPGQKITLHWFDGEECSAELEIAAVTPDTITENTDAYFSMTDQTMRKLWGDMNTAVSFAISVDDYQKNGDQAEQQIRPLVESYPDLRLLTLREKMIDDASAVQNLTLQVYGISAFIILFSLLNLVNTLISGIAIRRKELAMLESIGMDEKQIRSMLLWESFFLVLPNIVFTFSVGTAAGYGAVAFMKTIVNYMDYQVPMAAGAVYLLCMVLVPMLISYVCLKGLNRTSLVERIR